MRGSPREAGEPTRPTRFPSRSGGNLRRGAFMNYGLTIGIIWGVQLGRAERADCCLHAVSPPGRLPRAGRPAEAGTVPRLGVLGQACAELWRADRAAADCRAGACGARGQSYRAHLHRRCFRRFPVRRAAPGGLLNQPISVHRDDGLKLYDAAITAAVHCAPPDNKPTPDEHEHASLICRRPIG